VIYPVIKRVKDVPFAETNDFPMGFADQSLSLPLSFWLYQIATETKPSIAPTHTASLQRLLTQHHEFFIGRTTLVASLRSTSTKRPQNIP